MKFYINDKHGVNTSYKGYYKKIHNPKVRLTKYKSHVKL